MTIPPHEAGAFFPLTTQNLLRVVLIIAAGVWVFFPALHGGLLMDDAFYISLHPLRHDPLRLWKVWFQPGSFIEYYPLEGTVRWLQWQLWQDAPFGYHLTNLLLHLASALLVWRVLARFGLRQAWLGGLLFAIHPVTVESVAWMAELKNTLSLPPFLLAISFYLDYETNGRKRDYRLALLFFLVAMLCKISMALFPLVILLHAWWKRDRIGWADLKAAAPFLVITLVLVPLSVASGIWYQQLNTAPPDPIPVGGFFSRLALTGLTIAFYFSKCVLPVNLLFVYPQWKVDPPSPLQFLPLPILAGAIFWLWTKRRNGGRPVLLGLGFFLILIGPFTGFQPISYMSFSWVMDHFLYIPLIGLIGLAVAGWEMISQRLSATSRRFGFAGIAGVMALLAWGSHVYAAVFVDQETLWTYTLHHNPDAWIASNNLGQVRLEQGRIDDAAAEFRDALRINPNLPGPHINLGNIHGQMGQYTDAIGEYQEALRVSPTDARAENNWGNTLFEMGRYAEAATQYRAAVQFQPNYAQAHVGLGLALIQTGDVSGGIQEYREALRLQPNDADAHYNLGIVLGQTGQMDQAIDEFTKASLLNPDDPAAHFNLAIALTQARRIADAIREYEEVLRLKPDSAPAAANLARLKSMAP